MLHGISLGHLPDPYIRSWHMTIPYSSTQNFQFYYLPFILLNESSLIMSFDYKFSYVHSIN